MSIFDVKAFSFTSLLTFSYFFITSKLNITKRQPVSGYDMSLERKRA